MTTEQISNSQDVIDSRDIIERIDELESGLEDLFEDAEDKGERTLEEYIDFLDEQGNEDAQEYINLKKLADEAEDYSEDWKYGATLIRDSYFEEYTQELAEDLGYINKDVQWPYTCIDWEQAAKELQMDYTQIDFDGVDYWVR